MKKQKQQVHQTKKVVLCVAATVVLAAILLAVALIMRKKNIDEDFFTITDTRYVASFEDKDFGASRTHLVVEHKGDQITAIKEILEYDTDNEARIVYQEIKESFEGYGNLELDQKYVILSQPEEEFKNKSANNLIAEYELLKQLNDQSVEDLE